MLLSCQCLWKFHLKRDLMIFFRFSSNSLLVWRMFKESRFMDLVFLLCVLLDFRLWKSSKMIFLFRYYTRKFILTAITTENLSFSFGFALPYKILSQFKCHKKATFLSFAIKQKKNFLFFGFFCLSVQS